MNSKEKSFELASLVADKKAGAISILEIGKLSSIADYLVICSGESERQVKAIVGNAVDAMKEKGERPIGVEGNDAGRWVLVDYGDVVLHVFFESVRIYYDLEGLWADAPRLELPEEIVTEGA